ncbi:hypothetical protein KPB05_09860 [Burkholderia gladioli]|uniref:hypothetical protein n=1 Tax=Burkholderia gladioli TaxID=28095 RepID=UPI00285D9224|nr:hypothetical protein [Burkholderia gladioli]MDR8087765.1 hypothetical protein [Burkholderia gladioli]
MPMKSSLVTGGITIGVTDLVPTVDWVLGGCRGPVPASLSSLIAGLLAAAFHAGVNWFAERAESRSAGGTSGAIVVPKLGTTVTVVGAGAASGGGVMPAPTTPASPVATAPTATVAAT